MNWQLTSIVLFYLVIFALGVYAGHKQGGDKTTGGLLLAGRGMPLWIGVLTMTATWVGGGYINGTAEVVYDKTQGLVWAQAPWCYALSMVLGGLFFARRMRRMGYTTLLDPFERRFGKRVSAPLFLAALVGEVFWSAAILFALGTTFSLILQRPIACSILISAGVAIGYTMVGGLWSVAYTDVAQLLCLLVGLCVAVPFALSHSAVGGAGNVLTRYVASMPAFPSGSALWQWGDMALLMILGGIPWQVYFQRVLAARDERTAVGLSLFGAAGCMVMALPAVAIGAIGSAADWSQTSVAPPKEAALILPLVLQHLTPVTVATIGLGAVAAAVMSSVDSSILSGSSMFVWNVYRPLFRPNASDREMRCVLRGVVVLVGAAATALALSVSSVYTLWFLCSDIVYVVLFPQLVMVLFCRTANRSGAIAGVAMSLVLRFLPYPPEFPFRTIAMLGGLATIWLVSQMTAGWDVPNGLDDGVPVGS